jgi:hypothetical protein
MKGLSWHHAIDGSKVRFSSRLIDRMVAIGGVMEVDTSVQNQPRRFEVV